MDFSDLTRAVRVGLLYFVFAALALKLTRFDGGIAFLWLATPYLIAELSMVPRRKWSLLLLVSGLASMLATGTCGLGWQAAGPLALANLLEAWVGAYYVRRHGPKSALTTLSWFGRFTIFAAIIPSALSAGLVGLLALGMGQSAVQIASTFFAAHALSTLTFAPIFILLGKREISTFLRQNSHRVGETFGLIALSFMATTACFTQSALPLLFLPILPIILTTFRLGRGGAVITILFLALFGGAATLASIGPVQLISGGHGLRMQFFQFYLAMTVFTAWPVAADLSNRSRLHRMLRLSKERYRLIADHSSDILMQLSTEGLITYVSPSIRQLGGYEPSELIGMSAGMLVAPPFRESVSGFHQTTISCPEQTQCFEYEAVLSDGRRRWFETHSRAVLGNDGSVDGTLSIIRDVTDRKDAERALSVAAATDPLTGLLNRRAFYAMVGRLPSPAARRGDRNWIVVFDIDHFKRVNDTHGHDAGDTVLCAFAATAVAAIGERGQLARLGGEEFALYLEGASAFMAQQLCERLRRAVAMTPTVVRGRAIWVTVSGGIAPLAGGDLDAAIRQADVALYQAKADGRNRLAVAA